MNGKGIFGERYEARIARAIAHVERNQDKPMTLASLAEIACLSPFHFRCVFRAMTGEPAHAFIERRRLELAIDLVRAGHSCKSASAASGFASPVSFPATCVWQRSTILDDSPPCV